MVNDVKNKELVIVDAPKPKAVWAQSNSARRGDWHFIVTKTPIERGDRHEV